MFNPLPHSQPSPQKRGSTFGALAPLAAVIPALLIPVVAKSSVSTLIAIYSICLAVGCIFVAAFLEKHLSRAIRFVVGATLCVAVTTFFVSALTAYHA